LLMEQLILYKQIHPSIQWLLVLITYVRRVSLLLMPSAPSLEKGY